LPKFLRPQNLHPQSEVKQMTINNEAWQEFILVEEATKEFLD